MVAVEVMAGQGIEVSGDLEAHSLLYVYEACSFSDGVEEVDVVEGTGGGEGFFNGLLSFVLHSCHLPKWKIRCLQTSRHHHPEHR